jgi:hypothetical protein
VNTSQATVDDDNAKTLSEAATYGSIQAVDQQNAPTPFSAEETPKEAVQGVINEMLRDQYGVATRDVKTDTTINGDCGGSATFSNATQTGGTIIYNNYCTSGMVMSGRVDYTIPSGGGYTFNYSNFTVSYGGESYSFNMTVSCDAQYNCSYSEDFTGSDGRTYRVEDSSVSGTNASGYNVSATVYDEDYGYIDISASGLTFNCSNGFPGTGTISITGGGGSSASVTFNSCTSYTVTINGVGSNYTW